MYTVLYDSTTKPIIYYQCKRRLSNYSINYPIVAFIWSIIKFRTRESMDYYTIMHIGDNNKGLDIQ